jgi:hypothetical protein
MAGIKTVLTELMTKLATLTVTNGSNQSVPLYTRIWNNQFRLLAEGDTYNFPFPCAFVEILRDHDGDSTLGQGIAGYDVRFRIHLGMDFYDAGDGTMEQNLNIFDLKDQVIALLQFYEMSQCGGLQCINEGQDYNHTNLYHYTVDFVCHFIEGAGDQTTDDRTTGPPTGIEIDPTVVTVIT